MHRFRGPPRRPERETKEGDKMERTYTTVELWTYRDVDALGVDMTRGVDITGFEVEATDGSIGKIDEATYDVGSSYIVVDTGPWIFGKKVMLPAAVVQRVDLDSQTVVVDRTKDEIKDAPEFDENTYREQEYRSQVGSYYNDTDR
jgi:PRC-barrel domain protein